MILEKHMAYHRHDPGKHVTLVEIRSDEELAYHRSLVEKGYEYTLLEKSKPDTTTLSKPRIHPGSSVCESCEG